MVELSENLSDMKVFLNDDRAIGKITYQNYVQNLDEFLTIIEDVGSQISTAKNELKIMWST